VDGLSEYRLLKKPFTADEHTRSILRAMNKSPTTLAPQEHRA
jgi:hypothetical protein